MAQNKVITGRDGRATLISDSFAPYGEVGGVPTRAEDPSTLQPQVLSDGEVLTREGWDADQLELAKQYGFPAGEHLIDTKLQLGGVMAWLKGTKRTVYRAEHVVAYDAAMAALGYRR